MPSILKTRTLPGILFCALALTLPFATPAQQAGRQPVFRIGEFNRSSVEFASGDPKQKVTFVVSKSDPAKDWFGWQPALLAPAGRPQDSAVANAPRTISFTVEHPADSYRLHLGVLIETPSMPALKVEINGKKGLFYLHPKLDYNNGDQQGSFYPAYSYAEIEFTFPGSYLKPGANTLSLQAIEEADEAVPDAGLHYDALELTSVPRDAASQAPAAQIVPTVFYHQQNGQLLEEVEAFICHAKPLQPGSPAELTIGKETYRAQLRGGTDFGEEKATFAVREFQPQTAAQLAAQIDGAKQHFKQSIDPAKKWTIFVVPHIHVDVGYSDYQAKVAAIQSRAIGEAMDMVAKHPDFRFSLDGEWDLEQYLQTRTPAEQQRAIQAFQKQQIYLPAQYASLLTGLPTAETLIRSMMPSANFSRIHGTPLDFANITDVPSYSWSYASILASSGINYLAAGSDNYRAPILLQGRLNENTPAWWVGPDGKKILLWYSRHYMHMQFLFGLPPVLAAGRDILPIYLQNFAGANYRANSTILFGTQVENTDLFPQQAELAGNWNSAYAYPRLQYSGFHEAMQNIEKQFGGNIPTIRGDGGPYWEDGAGSDAYYVAMERWNEARAQSAEKLDTLASLANPVLKTDTAELGQMWRDMVLMDEHTWDSFNSVSDPATREAVEQLAGKDQLAVNAAAKVDFIVKRSMANLADVIPAGTGSLIVFNTLNWTRGGSVTIDLNKGDEIFDPTTNQPVHCEILSAGSGTNRVRFFAQGVPPFGYKVYTVRPGQAAAPNTVMNPDSTLENSYYKVQLDPATGAVLSIYDKELKRQLVNQQSPYRFGQYLYVTGGDKDPNSLLHYSRAYAKPQLEIHSARNGKIVSVVHTPTGLTATLESESLNTPSIKTEIRLFDNEKKIEFVETVDKKEVLTKEAVYFAFPFAIDHPQFQYEIQNGVVDPAKDMLPGAGHEWFTAQHWVSVQQEGLSATVMPLDAPLITLGDINRGEWPEQFGNRPGNIFSYVMNNYWDTNYRAGQGGRFTFHYIVTSAASTASAALSHKGWEEITPLETDFVTTQDKALIQPAAPGMPVLDAKQGSFIECGDAELLLLNMKPAEDGQGYILRFLDLGGAERSVPVSTPLLRLAHASQTDALERGRQELPLDGDRAFHFTVHPHEIVTIRIEEAGK